MRKDEKPKVGKSFYPLGARNLAEGQHLIYQPSEECLTLYDKAPAKKENSPDNGS